MLALDIGGTKIAAAMLDEGAIVMRRQVAMPGSAEAFGRALAELTADMPAPERVAVASTGFVQEGRIHAVNQNIISFWNGFALRDFLAARFACPIVILNDAQAAAWAEYQACETPPGNLLYLTLSTGVGGGLVIGGRLQVGACGLAGHIGHATVSLPSPAGRVPCGCGRTGCLETLASGTAIAREATRVFGEPLDSREVFARAVTDRRAERILAHAARAVAEAIANCVMLLDVDHVVIGGSVGLAPGMVERIQAALMEEPVLVRVAITKAALGPDSGLIGAAQWAQAFEGRVEMEARAHAACAAHTGQADAGGHSAPVHAKK
ncbi:N-acetylmannosamine kinase [Paraburkholderia unamae]|uniref:N-acetylmannosamine kinase n=1 Tax=Paraburkholderia unamae TaxID=219649 RepID=UPI000DC1F94D|nr:N-acetylmannosamine kinase [Paraburkholderia unamae]RAR53326.1 N-acetylmannosamine kinase [Paraburkholderia unamae]CAG9261708.1 N-acetylmannosamine kinase [Paraburkholderia unamae]